MFYILTSTADRQRCIGNRRCTWILLDPVVVLAPNRRRANRLRQKAHSKATGAIKGKPSREPPGACDTRRQTCPTFKWPNRGRYARRVYELGKPGDGSWSVH